MQHRPTPMERPRPRYPLATSFALCTLLLALLAGCASPPPAPTPDPTTQAPAETSTVGTPMDHRVSSATPRATTTPRPSATDPGTVLSPAGLCSTSTSPFDPVTAPVPARQTRHPGLVELSGEAPWLHISWWVDVPAQPAIAHDGQDLIVTGGAGTEADPWEVLLDRPSAGEYHVGYTASDEHHAANGSVHAVLQHRQGDYVCKEVLAGESTNGFLVPAEATCTQSHAFGRPTVMDGVAWLAQFQEDLDWLEVRAWSIPPAPLVLDVGPEGNMKRFTGHVDGDGSIADPWRARIPAPRGNLIEVGVVATSRPEAAGAMWVGQQGGDAYVCGPWADGLGTRRTFLHYAERTGCDGFRTQISSGGPDAPPFRPGDAVAAGNHALGEVAHFVATWSADSPSGLRPYFEGPGGFETASGSGTAADPWRVHLEDPPQGEYFWGSEVIAQRQVLAQQGLAVTQATEGLLLCDDIMDDMLRSLEAMNVLR